MATTTSTQTSAAAQTDTGTIVLAAIPISLAASIPDADGSTTITYDKSYNSTYEITTSSENGITITNDASAGGDKFTVGQSATYTQSQSNQVTNGVAISRDQSISIGTASPGSYANTNLYGLMRPTIKLSGTAAKLGFKLLKADSEFSYAIGRIQAGGLFDPVTTAALLALDPVLNDPSGNSLTLPRFKPRLHLSLTGGNPFTRTFSRGGTASFSQQLTTSTSVTIVDSIGFSLGLFKDTFSKGKTLTLTHTSVQTVTTGKTFSLAASFTPHHDATILGFWDRVLKTFQIVSIPGVAAPAVQGRVVDAQGHAIGGALVRVRQNGIDYAAVSDASGNYGIGALARASFTPGAAQLVCGNVTKPIALGSGAVHADLSGVDVSAARANELDLSDF
jgi:hypothetical protein